MGVVAAQLGQQENGRLINPKPFAPNFIINDWCFEYRFR